MARDAKSQGQSSRTSVVLRTGCAIIAVAITALAAAQEAAPGSEDSETPAPADSVTIVVIRPDPSFALIAGEKVRLEVEVEYAFWGSEGALALVIQGGHGVAIQSQEAPVSPGRGVASLEVTFMVPDTAKLHVFTPLAEKDAVQARAVDGRAFRVERKETRAR